MSALRARRCAGAALLAPVAGEWCRREESRCSLDGWCCADAGRVLLLHSVSASARPCPIAICMLPNPGARGPVRFGAGVL